LFCYATVIEAKDIYSSECGSHRRPARNMHVRVSVAISKIFLHIGRIIQGCPQKRKPLLRINIKSYQNPPSRLDFSLFSTKNEHKNMIRLR